MTLSAYDGSADFVDSNPLFLDVILQHTLLDVKRDIGNDFSDVTSKCLLSSNKNIGGRVLAKNSGVMAGVSELSIAFSGISDTLSFLDTSEFSFDFNIADGDSFSSGDVLLTLYGNTFLILALERMVLNFLSRMSGIATNTYSIVKKLSEFNIVPASTRKTLWGLLDKKAVFVGGGLTHRLNLSDAILVKENHLSLFNGDFSSLLTKLLSCDFSDIRFLEVEVESFSQFKLFISLLTDSYLSYLPQLIFMFDNFSPSDISKAMTFVKTSKYYNKLLFEASGGINSSNFLSYSETGVDVISMGALTMDSLSSDFSMYIKTND